MGFSRQLNGYLLGTSVSQCTSSGNLKLEKQYFLLIIYVISVLRVCCLKQKIACLFGPWLFDVVPLQPQHTCPFIFTCSTPKTNDFPTVWAFRTLLWSCICLILHKISTVSPRDFTPEDFVCLYYLVLSRTFWPILNEHQICIWQLVQPLPKAGDFSVLV